MSEHLVSVRVKRAGLQVPIQKAYTRHRAGRKWTGTEIVRFEDLTAEQWEEVRRDPVLEITDPWTPPEKVENDVSEKDLLTKGYDPRADAERDARLAGKRGPVKAEVADWEQPKPPGPAMVPEKPIVPVTPSKISECPFCKTPLTEKQIAAGAIMCGSKACEQEATGKKVRRRKK